MQELESCDMGEDFDVDGIHVPCIPTERVEPCVSTHLTQKLYMIITKEPAGKWQKAAIIHVC